jgi:hypothetical protein
LLGWAKNVVMVSSYCYMYCYKPTAYVVFFVEIAPKLLFCLALVRSHLSCMPVRSATRISSRDLMILDWRVFKDERPSSYSKAMGCLILIPWKSLIYCPCRTAWLEIKNRIFFFKWKDGLYDLDISSYVNFSSNRSSRTRSSNANLL